LIYGIIIILALIFIPRGIGPLKQRYISSRKLELLGRKFKLIFKR
jgi:hypothetical protein